MTTNNSSLIDRSIAPDFQDISTIPTFQFHQRSIDGVNVIKIDQATQNVSKIELVYDAGQCYDLKNGISYFTSKMLLEGTLNHTKEEFFEKLDFWGAQIDCASGKEFLSISIYCLNRFILDALKLVEELIHQPKFEENALKKLQEKATQELNIKKEKTAFLAQIEFEKNIYGSSSSYIGLNDEKSINQITIEDIKLFHKENILHKKARLLLREASMKRI